MKQLANITQVVKIILMESPEARDDDYLLWLKVIEKVAEWHRIPDFTKTMTFGTFLTMAKYSQFPHFESVSRARRKLQEKYEILRGTERTRKARAELEAVYEEYSKTEV